MMSSRVRSGGDNVITSSVKSLNLSTHPHTGEINGLARLSGLPLKFVQSIQMLYEVRLRRGGGCTQGFDLY